MGKFLEDEKMATPDVSQMSISQLREQAKDLNLSYSSNPVDEKKSLQQKITEYFINTQKEKNAKVGEEIAYYQLLDGQHSALQAQAEAVHKRMPSDVNDSHYSELKGDYRKKQKAADAMELDYSIAFDRARRDATSPFLYVA